MESRYHYKFIFVTCELVLYSKILEYLILHIKFMESRYHDKIICVTREFQVIEFLNLHFKCGLKYFIKALL